MPLYIQDETASYLKTLLLSAIFSAIAYGIVIVLSGNCFHLLQKKRGIYSNRMQIFLLIYVIVMLLSSTWTLVDSICLLMTGFVPIHAGYLLYRPFTLPLTMWGADGFMVRIIILLQEQRVTM
jgi:hypothetical protein